MQGLHLPSGSSSMCLGRVVRAKGDRWQDPWRGRVPDTAISHRRKPLPRRILKVSRLYLRGSVGQELNGEEEWGDSRDEGWLVCGIGGEEVWKQEF